MKEPLIMDEQDKIDLLKVQMRARSRATLHLKRASAALLRRVDKTYEDSYMKEEREALRKALLNIPFCDAPSIPLTDPPNADLRQDAGSDTSNVK